MDTLNSLELNRFQSPIDLYNKVRPGNLGIPNRVFFTSSKAEHQKLRETWAASLLAIGLLRYYPDCKVRIVTESDFPDFEIKINDSIYPFEFTEVQKEGRRRGDEYKRIDEDQIQVEEYCPKFCKKHGANWVLEQIKKKSDKNYCPVPHLLVYANFEGKPNIEKIRNADVVNVFRSVWILWDRYIIQVFPSKEFGNKFNNWEALPNGILP